MSMRLGPDLAQFPNPWPWTPEPEADCVSEAGRPGPSLNMKGKSSRFTKIHMEASSSQFFLLSRVRFSFTLHFFDVECVSMAWQVPPTAAQLEANGPGGQLPSPQRELLRDAVMDNGTLALSCWVLVVVFSKKLTLEFENQVSWRNLCGNDQKQLDFFVKRTMESFVSGICQDFLFEHN